MPGDPDQVMYVWFDALTNYITALGYATNGELYRRYWVDNPRRVHVIGKGIVRFHAVYWPAMLLSAGEPLPQTVFVHGYLTIAGEKISKSLRIVAEALRPFLPATAERIAAQLGVPLAETAWIEALTWGGLRPGTEVAGPQPIFPKERAGAPMGFTAETQRAQRWRREERVRSEWPTIRKS